mmetsp:Transcript_82549/g.129972  ORF Transcript_82549/g.129972 Transcript_82549/m.129972 type:complete len:1049 (+) Transcript_82549:40-3186(+)
MSASSEDEEHPIRFLRNASAQKLQVRNITTEHQVALKAAKTILDNLNNAKEQVKVHQLRKERLLEQEAETKCAADIHSKEIKKLRADIDADSSSVCTHERNLSKGRGELMNCVEATEQAKRDQEASKLAAPPVPPATPPLGFHAWQAFIQQFQQMNAAYVYWLTNQNTVQQRVQDATEKERQKRAHVEQLKVILDHTRSRLNTKHRDLLDVEAKHDAAQAVYRRTKAEVKAKLPVIQSELQAATQQVESLEKTFKATQDELSSLRSELDAGKAGAIQPHLCRLVSLPPDLSSGHSHIRFTDLVALVEMDWCVGLGPASEMKLQEFLDGCCGSLSKALLAGSDELCILKAEADSQHAFVSFSNPILKELRSDRLKILPPRLNAFDLLRASLGDPHFHDLHLRPPGVAFYQQALGFDRMTDIPVPEKTAAALRPYQKRGFQWMASLARNGLGAVLADDMGLGKTLQAITLILYLKEAGLMTDQHGQPRPSLVAVPPGLVMNWQREFDKWAGNSLKVHSYYGMKRSLPPNHGVGVDVVLTSYHTLRLDSRKFVDPDQISFSSMFLDEAQHIKNPKAQITKAIKQIGNIVGHSRFALSGTPVENKMDELHSIHDFVNFGYLGDQETFQRDFSRIIEQKKDVAARKTAADLLKRLIDPFQMRRLKTDKNILPDLPDRIDYQCPVELTPIQKEFYLAAQEEFTRKLDISRQQAANHNFERRGHIFAQLEKCRIICCHPAALLQEKRPAGVASSNVSMLATESGKCSRLMELLEDIIASNQKVLVFLMRRRVVDLLKTIITAKFRGTKVLKMTGEVSVKERVKVEKAFQEDEDCKVLLLTVGVGGVGLNLTAASHVIHFDRCYNPAKEQQATDRSHRLGQRHAVCVHTLVTTGTYEERLDDIMREKSELSNMTVTTADDWIASYDDDEVRELFMLRSSSSVSVGSSSTRALQRKGRSKRALDVDVNAASAAAESEPSSSSKKPRREKTKSSANLPATSASERTSEEECAVCMDGPASHKVMPCGHRLLCGDCAGLVQHCPMCRCEIKQRVQCNEL